MVHTCNSVTQEGEAEGQKFKAILGYTESSRTVGLETPSQEKKKSEHFKLSALSGVKHSRSLFHPVKLDFLL